MVEFTVQTSKREELLEITERVSRAVAESGVPTGVCVIFCPHTTAGVTINECSDPAVALDLIEAFGRLVPHDGPWRHLEGNSAAHAKASLVGSSVQVAIENGRPLLGTWQGIYLCEFDGPRSRKIWLHFVS